jgi:hypothetical protein
MSENNAPQPDSTPSDDERRLKDRLAKHPLWPKFISDFFKPQPKEPPKPGSIL